MIKSYQINVIGRVQGVGFRCYTKQAADKHHIVGWVKTN
ncbi:acylphosphatase [Leuconostoc citreum]